MVQDAARGAHHHIGTMLQALHLPTQGHATAQGDHFHVRARTCQTADFLRDLVGQLAGRAQHHRLHGGTRYTSRLQALDQRQAKRSGLAAARAGLGHQVLAVQGEGQAGRLNRRHAYVAQLFEVVERGG